MGWIAFIVIAVLCVYGAVQLCKKLDRAAERAGMEADQAAAAWVAEKREEIKGHSHEETLSMLLDKIEKPVYGAETKKRMTKDQEDELLEVFRRQENPGS